MFIVAWYKLLLTLAKSCNLKSDICIVWITCPSRHLFEYIYCQFAFIGRRNKYFTTNLNININNIVYRYNTVPAKCNNTGSKHVIFKVSFTNTRRYSPLRGPTSSSCGGLRPSAEAFFALRAKKELIMLSNFERNPKKPKKSKKKQKNS